MSVIEISAIESLFAGAQAQMEAQGVDPASLDPSTVVLATHGPKKIYDASSVGCYEHSTEGPLTDEALDTALGLVDELETTTKRLRRPAVIREVAGAALGGTGAGAVTLYEMGQQKHEYIEEQGESDQTIGDRIWEDNDLIWDDSLIDVPVLDIIPGIPDYATQAGETTAEVPVHTRANDKAGESTFATGAGIVGVALLAGALLRSRARHVHRKAQRMARKAGMEL